MTNNVNADSCSSVPAPFPFPAFPVGNSRFDDEVKPLVNQYNDAFPPFPLPAPFPARKAAEILVPAFPYILRIYGGEFPIPSISEALHCASPETVTGGDHHPALPVMLVLDLGTHTGWAARDSQGSIASGTEDFTPHRFEGGGMRYLRFKHWLTELKATLGGIQAVYFEEVRRHKGVDAAHTYGGFMAHLTAWCEHHAIPYQGIPVGTIKKSITGSGNANKQAVIDAVRARGFSPADDNEADALALLDFILNQHTRRLV